MAHAPSTKRLQANDYPAALRPFVEAFNTFAASVTNALGSVPTTVVREITITAPASWVAPTLAGLWLTLYGPIGYSKDASGIVRLRGVLTGGTYSTTALFTLPAGFRPSVTRYLPVAQSSLFEPAGVVQILPTGEVIAPIVTSVQSGASTYLSLDGVAFEASDLSPSAPLALDVTAAPLSNVSGVAAIACFDVTTGSPIAAPCPAVSWAPSAAGIRIASLAGLAAGRRYTVRLALTAV